MHIRNLLDNGRKRVNQLHKVITLVIGILIGSKVMQANAIEIIWPLRIVGSNQVFHEDVLTFWIILGQVLKNGMFFQSATSLLRHCNVHPYD